jgi:hypothetical protein
VISGNRVWHHQQQWKLLADNCSADIENASSERKIWLATTGREFEEEVIEQLAVTPKFVVRGEVLPSYGHRSGIATSLQLFIAVTKLVSNFCWISSLRTRWTVTLFCRRWARLSANG